jgi:hypothetical protein
LATVQKKIDQFTKCWKSRKAKASPSLVKVSWLDACMHTGGQIFVGPGWRENYQPGTYMETVGYLLFADKNWVTVAMERQAEPGQTYFRDWQDIPRYSIAEFEILKKETK